jgi:cytochrome P450
MDIPFIPILYDPPQHTAYRHIIMRMFTPEKIGALELKARALAVSLIEAMQPRGSCEFVAEFADKLPIIVFLGMMDLPLEDREYLTSLAEIQSRDPDVSKRTAANDAMRGYLETWIAKRTADPGTDIISQIVTARIDGRALTPFEVMGMCRLLLGGGLDTVAAMIAFSARFLALNPAHRRQLAEDPELIALAVDELIRRHGVSNTARLITHDFAYHGVQLKQDELICIPNCLYGLDERIVADPLIVDFRRQRPIPLAAFGNGPHTCPGAALARREIRVFLQEWLRRIPDFEITPGTRPVMETGIVSDVRELHLSWPTAA